jgi:hypothetical protein
VDFTNRRVPIHRYHASVYEAWTWPLERFSVPDLAVAVGTPFPGPPTPQRRPPPPESAGGLFFTGARPPYQYLGGPPRSRGPGDAAIAFGRPSEPPSSYRDPPCRQRVFPGLSGGQSPNRRRTVTRPSHSAISAGDLLNISPKLFKSLFVSNFDRPRWVGARTGAAPPPWRDGPGLQGAPNTRCTRLSALAWRPGRRDSSGRTPGPPWERGPE